MQKIILTISGPSAGGKSTLVNGLLKHFPNGRICTYTNRPQRTDEPSDAYFFATDDQIDNLNNRLWDFSYVGNRYAVTSDIVQGTLRQSSGLAFIDITTTGGQHAALQTNLESHCVELLPIFLVSPGDEILRQRMSTRSDGTREKIERRIREGYEIAKAAHAIEGMQWIKPKPAEAVLTEVLGLIRQRQQKAL